VRYKVAVSSKDEEGRLFSDNKIKIAKYAGLSEKSRKQLTTEKINTEQYILYIGKPIKRNETQVQGINQTINHCRKGNRMGKRCKNQISVKP